MKKFLIAVIFTAVAFCCNSCYKSVETDLGDGLTSFTVKVDKQVYLGLKDSDGNVLLKPQYNIIHYVNGIIVAAKDGYWNVFSTTGERMFGDFRIEKFSYGTGFSIFETSRGKYFYAKDGTLSGPASGFTYYPNRDLAIVESNGAYGLIKASSGEELLKPQYSQVVIAYDKNGNLGYYALKGKTYRRVVGGKERNLSSSQTNALKRDASANKTPWPEGNGFVRVSSLR